VGHAVIRHSRGAKYVVVMFLGLGVQVVGYLLWWRELTITQMVMAHHGFEIDMDTLSDGCKRGFWNLDAYRWPVM
jgi:hypothetical protein